MQSMSGGGFTYNRFDAYEAQLAEAKKAKKDYDGDGEVESSKDEYFGSKDKAIKKAMGKGTCKKCEESKDDCGCDDKKEVKENASCGSTGYQEGGEVKAKKKKVVKEDVINHLIDEGYTNNEVSAELLFDNISDEFLESIEDDIMEIYQGRHGQSEKQYQDGRSPAGKMISGDSKGSGANYSYRAKNTGANPAGGSQKPQGQARMNSKDRAFLAYQKARR
jgi:hypothetical protein